METKASLQEKFDSLYETVFQAMMKLEDYPQMYDYIISYTTGMHVRMRDKNNPFDVMISFAVQTAYYETRKVYYDTPFYSFRPRFLEKLREHFDMAMHTCPFK